MSTIDHEMLLDVFGTEALNNFDEQDLLIQMKSVKLNELYDLRERAAHAFNINLSLTDIAVAASAGVLLGIANALYKDFVPKSGYLKHEHITKRTAIDYNTPSPVKPDLHRQLGPSHDINRFKETLKLISGEQTDFELWGTTINKIMGSGNPEAAILRANGMNLHKFIEVEGFRIPSDPKAELLHHLMIDFFTKRSLPIPGSTFIADHSKDLAKIMSLMYSKGFNLKSLSGNFIGFSLLQLVIHGYVFLFKALPSSGILTNGFSMESIKTLITNYNSYLKSNEFHVIMMIGHGSSFLVDTLITTGCKNYVGLFQLNYASLFWFSKHLIQYVVKCREEQKQLMNQVLTKCNEIDIIEDELYFQFKNRFDRLSNDDLFRSFIDPISIMESHITTKKLIIDRKDLNKKMASALKELRNEK